MKKYLFLEKYLRGDYYRKIIANGRPTFAGRRRAVVRGGACLQADPT